MRTWTVTVHGIWAVFVRSLRGQAQHIVVFSIESSEQQATAE